MNGMTLPQQLYEIVRIEPPFFLRSVNDIGLSGTFGTLLLPSEKGISASICECARSGVTMSSSDERGRLKTSAAQARPKDDPGAEGGGNGGEGAGTREDECKAKFTGCFAPVLDQGIRDGLRPTTGAD